MVDGTDFDSSTRYSCILSFPHRYDKHGYTISFTPEEKKRLRNHRPSTQNCCKKKKPKSRWRQRSPRPEL